MKKTKLITYSLIVLLFSSCVSTNRGWQSNPVESKKRTLIPELIADIEVDDSKKIRGSSSSTYFLMFRIEGDSEYADGVNYAAISKTDASSLVSKFLALLNPFYIINKIVTGDAQGKVISAAAYNALSGAGADFIAHPTYSFTKKNYLIIQQFSATVEGYGGTYSNFRKWTPEERNAWDLEFQVNKKIIEKFGIEVVK